MYIYDTANFFCEVRGRKRPPRLPGAGAFLRMKPVPGGTSGGARPPGREEKGMGKIAVCVGPSLSGWASAGNINAAPSLKLSAA